ncbi:type 1 glutamine amidotransferase [Citricoccus sp. SGAir0253]|uniref:type 1 glutamine amidotransferase domain-containing protein n=1 Tax=Citricoccus sp. SGAir0253 TaxID=2567881 RepID=UPI0010CCE4C2|nr:type 1 glutamine amidotransferase domain-containing protein [Citricoccus sp. SGAir0253]QCU77623.1 type 1 glutamine amidotransferase [Citricoccus sp. SGAir0253]
MTEQQLQGKTIAFLATRGVEQVELTSPWEAVEAAGGRPVLVSPESGTITAMQGDWEHGDTFTVDREAAAASSAEFDGLVMPGGTLNADALRVDEDVRAFVRGFFDEHKPVAAICHAPWTLINAGVVSGRRLTSYHSLSEDLRNAGATWVDEEVVVDQGLTTSRNPGDLDAFNAKLVEEFAEGRHAGQTA